ncbi:MAG: hypothetical protein AAF502_11780 [Bacteroidota bacterium]
MKYITLLILLFALGTTQSFSQETDSEMTDDIPFIDVVYLKDGSQFRGKIIEYDPAKGVEIQLYGGHKITFGKRVIKKIVQERTDCDQTKMPKFVKPYNFREKGIYNFTSTASYNTINDWGEVVVGASINHVVGYQFNRYVGLGIGTGIENMDLGNPLNSVPLYLETRGYFLKANSTPYYSVNIGMAFPLTEEERDIVGGRTGVLFHPAIGYRVGAGQVNFVIDAGYKIQRLTYEYSSRWEVSRFEKHTLKRLTVRLGVLF